MKKYISILMVVLVAFATMSCQFDGGTTPDTNRANRRLWERVQYVIAEQYEVARVVTLLNDKMREKEYVDKYIWSITEKENTYTMVLYGGDGYASEATYHIATDGKRLDEGGVWELSEQWYKGSINKLGCVEGVMSVASDVQLFAMSATHTYRSSYYNTIDSDISYLYDEDGGSLEMTLTHIEGLTTDYNYTSTNAQYTIEFVSAAPLIIRDGALQSGEIDILYKDLVENTERSLKVKIENKIITFATAQE